MGTETEAMDATVTGASGHIGANLIRELLYKGRRVRAVVHRDRRALEGLDVDVATGDVLDAESLTRAFHGTKTVYHLAGHITISHDDAQKVYAVNVKGMRNVLRACRDAGVRRLIHFSSIHALSSIPRDEIVDEKRPLAGGRSTPVYDRSKAEAEGIVLKAVENGFDAVIVNPTAIIGPNDFKPSYIGKFLLSLSLGRIRTLVQAGFDWVDVRDVVQGAIAAEERGRTGERYILSGTWLPIRELALIVEQVIGRRVACFSVPLWVARLGIPFISAISRMTGAEQLYTAESLSVLKKYRHVTCRKAETELGYRPRAITETIHDTLEWFGKQGFLHD
jgi:dihydroflavonol-4-reductase